jgi:transcriptional regulator with XRE-family HTH domain
MTTPDDEQKVRAEAREQMREFLTTRRERVTPHEAGLPNYGGSRRRVTGLRREEVALLAGVSTDYYTRLERGTATGVSDGVVEGVARALQLDEAERNHLYDLIRAFGGTGAQRRRSARREDVHPTVQRVVDSMHGTPAVVSNGRLDILHANALGRALFAPVIAFAERNRSPNSARFVFLEPTAKDFYRRWDAIADDTVALLHGEAGRDPEDPKLSDLIGELSVRSTEFRTRWAAHDVRIHTSGKKLVHHPVVGDLDLPYESFPLAAAPNLSLVTYSAEPRSPSEDALQLLASWAASNDVVIERAQTDQDA